MLNLSLIHISTLSMEKSGIPSEDATRLYYRRGHWRGTSSVIYKDGSEKQFSYSKTICAYKNAYFFEKDSCMYCQDHYANSSDISFGDIWLKEMKGNPIKHTSCVIRTQKAYDFLERAIKDGDIYAEHISDRDMVRSQKRALVFKFNAAKAKMNAALDTSDTVSYTHLVPGMGSIQNTYYQNTLSLFLYLICCLNYKSSFNNLFTTAGFALPWVAFIV